MQTVIPVGDPKAIRHYSTALAAETLLAMYWQKKFTGKGANNIIEQKDELEKDQGERIQFDLSVQLRQKPVRGDQTAKGKSENLRYYTDEVIIDQVRAPVSLGGRMSRKRTIHDQRMVAKSRQTEYWAAYMDQIHFMYLSGGPGINEDFIEYDEVTPFAGHGGNAFEAPDADHIIYGGSATAKANLTSSDKMTRTVIEKFSNKAKMMRARNPQLANLVPVVVEGAERYVVVMTPDQCYDMRTDTGATGWLEIQKAAAASEGSKNKIFKGGLGMINDVVLHEHHHVIRYNDYGVGTNVDAARAIALGRQAGVIAYGTPAGKRFQWEEEKDDFNNSVDICSGVIFGFKKSRFNGKDFGVVAIDTAATDPNG
ncbi:N4-gp56 family major capsid protein [Maritimibacter sp. DP1N21-5]|uniref:N4-gp56 family major capsid protein n=1 Tax=Maritimibacter sp. DP1N21-5 TaxID=2836867 RepID=UPI001C4809CA|nr:N4-gp56 family major capsid protein [Maritimibacter sp. DP1N21-5]MBV7408762.1 N4-gp56 family major capsid protein [Maritimibacter sp. DP1N21-5]